MSVRNTKSVVPPFVVVVSWEAVMLGKNHESNAMTESERTSRDVETAAEPFDGMTADFKKRRGIQGHYKGRAR